MEKLYYIFMSLKAESDLQKIIMYINNNLKEPNIAKKYLKMIKQEIKTLEAFPKKFAIIDKFNTRRLIIENYSVFYEICEESKTVYIKRILYSASDWENKI